MRASSVNSSTPSYRREAAHTQPTTQRIVPKGNTNHAGSLTP